MSLYVGFFGIPECRRSHHRPRHQRRSPHPESDPLFPVVNGVVSLVSNTLTPFVAGLVSLGLFFVGGLLASSGTGMVKAGRAKGL